jgi:hypothetical protein
MVSNQIFKDGIHVPFPRVLGLIEVMEDRRGKYNTEILKVHLVDVAISIHPRKKVSRKLDLTEGYFVVFLLCQMTDDG